MCDQQRIRGSRTSDQHDRRAAGARGRAGVLEAAARELIPQRAEEQVGVGGGHDVVANGANDRPDARLTHTGRSWNPVAAALGERQRAIAPDVRATGARRRPRP
jgi:hypothetical protein